MQVRLTSAEEGNLSHISILVPFIRELLHNDSISRQGRYKKHALGRGTCRHVRSIWQQRVRQTTGVLGPTPFGTK